MMTVMRKLIPWMLICMLMSGAFVASAAAPLPEKGRSSALGAGDGAYSASTSQGNGWTIYYHSATGKVRFMGGDPGRPLGQPAALQPGATPEAAALGFLTTYGGQFGLGDPDNELVVKEATAASGGRNFVRFQQVYQGIPVLAGELIVQIDASLNVISASGEVAPDLDLSINPLVSSQQAHQIALQVVARSYNLGVGDLESSQPELWIYSPPLLGAPGVQLDALAWRMEVITSDGSPVRELVLVDARLGAVLLHFNQLQATKYRLIYDNNNASSALPGNGPVRVEGGGASIIADVNNAYDHLGASYDFFASRFGRDSIDGQGMKLVATTRYCPSYPCPYDDSFWNGSQVVFGQGYASADDLVGHELAHGVMEYEADLFYYMQSGAINESFSDIWGEFIDLTYITASDTPTNRWLIGEDLPGGAIRSMQDPTRFDNPDRMSSSLFACDPYDGDQGGVHNNSGIGNKAAYLMVEGDTFNGVTVSGIGLDKAAQIFYEAQTNLLTSGADYADLGSALIQACFDLIGVAGIGTMDCAAVSDAVNATEMLQQPAGCATPNAPLCDTPPGGGMPAYLFQDDFENPASGRWSAGVAQGENKWFLPQSANPWGEDRTYTTSGAYNLWGYDQGITSDTWMAMNAPGVTLPASPAAYLHFSHAYQFDTVFISSSEEYYDGGVLEYSTNNGLTWLDAGGLPSINGYNGVLTDTFDDNPLETRPAFIGNSRGMISSRYDLTSLAGSNVRFRFRIGTGYSMFDEGWYIDDVLIYTCASQYQPQQIYIPLVSRGQAGLPPPVHISFNGSSPGWAAVNGLWLNSAAYLSSEGLTSTWASSSYDQVYSSLTYEARLKRAGCATCENALIIRGAPRLVAGDVWQDGYYFIYTADGRYAVRKVVGGSQIPLKALTDAPYVNTGQEWNVLRVEASGSNFKFLINGKQVWIGTDSSLASGQIGLGLSRNSASQWDRLSVDWITLVPAP